MKAMILAAGFGTRLRPLTNDTPKALISVANRPMLDWVILRLLDAGVRDIIVNTHHHAEQIHAYLAHHHYRNLQIAISYEPQILDTGGALVHAKSFFTDSEPFFVHNVDIISTFNLRQMLDFHRQQQALITLAVQKRPGTRQLLMDRYQRFCGRKITDDLIPAKGITGQTPFSAVAFVGVHVLEPRFFSLVTETGAFPIFDTYVRLAKSNERIFCFDIGQSYWLDLGKIAALSKFEKDLMAGQIPVMSALASATAFPHLSS